MAQQKQETAIQNAIRAELSQVGIVRRNNVGTYITPYGAPIKIGIPGEADLTLFAYGGKTIFIEVKTNKGKQHALHSRRYPQAFSARYPRWPK